MTGLSSGRLADDLASSAGAVVLLEDAAALAETEEEPLVSLGFDSLAAVVLARGEDDALRPALVDAVIPDAELEGVLGVIAANPTASTALALLLRHQSRLPFGSGLVAESVTYSTLQSGAEFARWRASRPVVEREEPAGPAVEVEREGDRLLIRLNRPHVRNAFDARMRDELVEAFHLARSDPSIEEVLLTGNGPVFCAGGDLDEFGSRPDPAVGHMVRLARSPARELYGIAERITSVLHGGAFGSGVEMPAFGHRVVAHAETRIGLPEVGLGLIPGAGGTVSLTRRIGRHHTMRLGLLADGIDAATAARWGIVDEVVTELPGS